MSTKLYDGLKLKDPKTDLFEVVNTLSAAIKARFKELQVPLIVQEFAKVVDSPPEDRKDEHRPLLTAWQNWIKQQEDFGDDHTLNDPLRFSIAFGRSNAGNILACAYYMSGDYGQVIKDTGLFEDYGYWDNTDRPEGVTEKQWGERGKEWDSVLDENLSLGSLPGWTLNSKGSMTFDLARIQDLIEEGVDLDSYLTPRQRLHMKMSALPLNSPLREDGSIDWGAVSRNIKTASEALKNVPEDSPLLPPPLPPLNATWGEIEPHTWPTVEEVLALAGEAQ